ncbi:Tigger transposable element-derived protein 4 [Thelohanellus kitauei]|uniref:Tigger transposable element-derived protein 4 n=1 Tax=Thelohanellus kitauei TaxID=669202 RepID=A0A0C2IZT7_THEKT|nr:Tigger transposable element-derived protein 4 [Thelohanellus kitauei]
MDLWNGERKGTILNLTKADDFGAESWSRKEPPSVIIDYEAKDIFNANETGLYWRVIPEGTLSSKNSLTAACKMAKERVTLFIPCNMDGSEKLKPPTIGKSKNPRCFKNVKTLPVDYEANKNS